MLGLSSRSELTPIRTFADEPAADEWVATQLQDNGYVEMDGVRYKRVLVVAQYSAVENV